MESFKPAENTNTTFELQSNLPWSINQQPPFVNRSTISLSPPRRRHTAYIRNESGQEPHQPWAIKKRTDLGKIRTDMVLDKMGGPGVAARGWRRTWRGGARTEDVQIEFNSNNESVKLRQALTTQQQAIHNLYVKLEEESDVASSAANDIEVAEREGWTSDGFWEIEA